MSMSLSVESNDGREESESSAVVEFVDESRRKSASGSMMESVVCSVMELAVGFKMDGSVER